MKLTHLSLFSGIGGLDLSAEWAGFETIGQCEYADFPTMILKKHWPNVACWRDIHELTAIDFSKRTGELAPTVISGGFPCQPHSVAGLRKGSCDERDLWGEYRRVIDEIRPKWIVAENVRGLLTSEDGRFFRNILRDFANLGYDVGWCCYGAGDIGAVHKRERVFIIAHIGKIRRQRVRSENRTPSEERYKNQKERCEDRTQSLQLPAFSGLLTEWYIGKDQPLICRNDDGFSQAVDRTSALGNAVVPQQAYPIFKAIADMESQ